MEKNSFTVNQLASFLSEQESRYGTMLGRIYRTEVGRLNRARDPASESKGGDYWSSLYRQVGDLAAGRFTLDQLIASNDHKDDTLQANYEHRLRRAAILAGSYHDQGFSGDRLVRQTTIRYRVHFVARFGAEIWGVVLFAGDNPLLSMIGAEAIASTVLMSTEARSRISRVCVFDLPRGDLHYFSESDERMEAQLNRSVLLLKHRWAQYALSRRFYTG